VQSIFKAEYPEKDQSGAFTTESAGKLLVKALEKSLEAKTITGEKGELLFPLCIFLTNTLPRPFTHLHYLIVQAPHQ
jgi:hypothetical protein